MSNYIGNKFLSLYDGCKQNRSPSECRDMVIRTVPPMVRGYLAAYDACLMSRILGVEGCRKMFAPAREGISPLKAVGIGVLVGFIIGRVL